MRQLLSITLTAQRRAHRLKRLSVPPPAHARSTSYRRDCVYHRPFMSRGAQRRSRKATLASSRGRQAGVGAARARSLLCTWCAWMVGLFQKKWRIGASIPNGEVTALTTCYARTHARRQRSFCVVLQLPSLLFRSVAALGTHKTQRPQPEPRAPTDPPLRQLRPGLAVQLTGGSWAGVGRARFEAHCRRTS
eukprot:scaffold70910_cov69-Phaeocystis_antarctica.AAC.9